MDIIDAQRLATDLIARHGLTSAGWRVAFTNAESRLGSCSYRTRRINLSRYMVAAATVNEVEQVILHEIAHALTPGHHHDAHWLRKAREIGYLGARTSPNPHRRSTQPSTALASATGAPRMLRTGEVGVITSGSRAGERLTIERVNRTRYLARSADGRNWTVPFSMLEPAGDDDTTPAAIEPTPATVHRPGSTVTIARGPRAGRAFTIEKVNRTRYRGRIAGLDGEWLVPFSAVR